MWHNDIFTTILRSSWHCIVGKSFGSYVTHQTSHFIYFYLDKFAILLFKSAWARTTQLIVQDCTRIFRHTQMDTWIKLIQLQFLRSCYPANVIQLRMPVYIKTIVHASLPNFAKFFKCLTSSNHLNVSLLLSLYCI